MKTVPLFALIFCLAISNCQRARGEATNNIAASGFATLPSGKQIRIVGIVPVHFANGSDALVLNCETDIAIDDKTALRNEANEIWAQFRNNAEGAKTTNAVIRITHPEGGAFITRSKGFGFVFEKRADGKWHCLQDEKK